MLSSYSSYYTRFASKIDGTRSRLHEIASRMKLGVYEQEEIGSEPAVNAAMSCANLSLSDEAKYAFWNNMSRSDTASQGIIIISIIEASLGTLVSIGHLVNVVYGLFRNLIPRKRYTFVFNRVSCSLIASILLLVESVRRVESRPLNLITSISLMLALLLELFLTDLSTTLLFNRAIISPLQYKISITVRRCVWTVFAADASAFAYFLFEMNSRWFIPFLPSVLIILGWSNVVIFGGITVIDIVTYAYTYIKLGCNIHHTKTHPGQVSLNRQNQKSKIQRRKLRLHGVQRFLSFLSSWTMIACQIFVVQFIVTVAGLTDGSLDRIDICLAADPDLWFKLKICSCLNIGFMLRIFTDTWLDYKMDPGLSVSAHQIRDSFVNFLIARKLFSVNLDSSSERTTENSAGSSMTTDGSRDSEPRKQVLPISTLRAKDDFEPSFNHYPTQLNRQYSQEYCDFVDV